MRYVMFMIPAVYGTPAADDPPSAEMIDTMMAYNTQLAEAGVLEAVDGLHPPSSGVRLHFEQSGAQTRDVPGQGAVGGMWIIKVDSYASAHAWAQRCPALPGDIVELRRIEGLDDVPTDVDDAGSKP
jgi:hypothetical protein